MTENREKDIKAQRPSPQILDRVVDGKKAWVRADIERDDWFFNLPPDCLDELRGALPELRRDKKRVERIDAHRCALPACRALIKRVQSALDDGVRFAVIDRLPMAKLSDVEAQSFYWILSSLLARPVQQKLTGTMIYKVHDTGRKAAAGSGDAIKMVPSLSGRSWQAEIVAPENGCNPPS